jgi:amidase
LRIGLTTQPFLDVAPDPAVVEAALDAGRLLESLGHDVEEGGPGRLEGVDLVDTFLTRWMAGQATVLDQLGLLLGREVGPEDVEPLTWALAEEGRRRSASQYLGAVAQHHGVARGIAGWFESGFDLLLTPTMGEPPTPLGAFDDSGPEPLRAIMRGVQTAAFTAIANATGQPAISLPLHWGDDGLPIGVQLLAPFGREDVLIRAAAQLEQARPWADRRPPAFAGATAAH